MHKPSVLGLVSYNVFPAQMGGQKGISEFYYTLAGMTKVMLAVTSENKVLEEAPFRAFPILYNHWLGIFNIRYIPALVKIVKKEAIDIIIIEHSYFGWLGWILRALTRKPFVIHSHNIEAHRFRDLSRTGWQLYALYEKWIHKKANASFFKNWEDADWAINYWGLRKEKCSIVPFGTNIDKAVTLEIKSKYRESICKQYMLPAETLLFLFTGSLDYLPNTEALFVIKDRIMPLLAADNFNFRIIICGKGLPNEPHMLFEHCPNIIFTGFVTDLAPFLYGTDCFINPVLLGGGIKVKVVEALAHNLRVISTFSGAKGISNSLTGEKLSRVKDGNWVSFAHSMKTISQIPDTDTPTAFYGHFNWNAIVQKALLSLSQL